MSYSTILNSCNGSRKTVQHSWFYVRIQFSTTRHGLLQVWGKHCYTTLRLSSEALPHPQRAVQEKCTKSSEQLLAHAAYKLRPRIKIKALPNLFLKNRVRSQDIPSHILLTMPFIITESRGWVLTFFCLSCL